MKRESFFILTLKGIGYVVLGNLLCLFMTMGLTMFGTNWFFNLLAMLCAFAIFFMLIFTVAWQNGVKERNLVKLGKVDDEKKYRWIWIGLILFVLAALPTVALLINKLILPEEDWLIIYRLVSGSAYPFTQAFIPSVLPETDAWVETTINQVDSMPVWFPILMLVYYALIPVATQLGYWCGFNDKLNKDKIMYK